MTLLNQKFIRSLTYSTLLFVSAVLTLLSPQIVRGLMPNLVFILLYHWEVNRLVFFKSPILIAVGILYDTIWEYPLGFHYGLFLLMKRIIYYQSRYSKGKDFDFLWIGIMGGYAVYLILSIGLNFILRQGCLPYSILFSQFLVTILFYPLVVRGIISLEQKMRLY